MSREGSRRGRGAKLLWRLLKLPPRLFYAIGLGPFYGRFVLLLTTTGRRSGLPRVTPLQYEEIDGEMYVGSARGEQADWFRNIQANPEVQVQAGSRRFRASAELVTEPVRIADFLELRLKRHPRMIGALTRTAGLPSRPDRRQLEAYAANRAMAILRPVEEGEANRSGEFGTGERS